MKLPSRSSLSNPTEEALWNWDTLEYFSPDPKAFWTIHYRNRLEVILSRIGSSVHPGGAILDVGCAQGTAALLLAERGYDVVAVDADPNCLRYARRRYESGNCRFICLDATAGIGLQAIRREFDAILLGEVLEHVPRPRKLLVHCRERLHPGGRLFVTTPNGESPHNVRFKKYDPAIMEAPERDGIPSGLGGRETHLLNFRMQSLLALTRSCGFEVDHSSYLNSYVINPLGFHRFLSAAVITKLNRFCSRIPMIARFSTMTLFVAARKG